MTEQPHAAARPEVPFPRIAGIDITSTNAILGPDTRLNWMLIAPAGYGKTELAGQLDELTQATLGKRTLYIACEPADGGGLATIRHRNVPMCIPKDWTDFYRITGMLRNNKEIGGIVLDSATELAKTHVKKAALAYPCRENVATRAAGIPTRSDYQTMGELLSQGLRALIAMTCTPDPSTRKHLIITAAEVQKEEDEKVVLIGPDLPGRMSREASQMFQQVLGIAIKPEVIDGKRRAVRYLSAAEDGVRVIKDRLKVLPEAVRLQAPSGGDGETLLTIWQKYYAPCIGA